MQSDRFLEVRRQLSESPSLRNDGKIEALGNVELLALEDPDLDTLVHEVVAAIGSAD
jgi:hypothetical protein